MRCTQESERVNKTADAEKPYSLFGVSIEEVVYGF